MSFGESIAELVQESSDPLLQAATSWLRVPLAEVAEVINGYAWPSSGFSSVRGEPVVRIRNVIDGETSTFFEGEIVDGFWVMPGDLLVGMDGDFNRNIWRGPKALLNQRVCRIAIDERFCDKRFLYYLIPAYLRIINANTSSVTVKHLSSKTLGEIPVPLPSLAEQKRIVAKLDALTAKSARARAELARIDTLVSRYKQAVLFEASSGNLTSEWRSARPDSDLWVTVKISDIAKVVTGTTPKSIEKDRFFGGDTPFFKPTDLDQGYYVKTPREFLSQEGVSVSRLVPAMATLVTCIGATIGKVGLSRVECCTNQQINALIPRLGVVVPEWLYWRISSPDFQELILDNSSATTLPIINKGRFQQLSLELPPIEEQHEIVRRIEAAFARIDRLAAEAKRALALLGKLDEAILAKAFRGELVPQDPADEPASVLLDRIRAERAAAPKVKRGRRPAG